MKIKKPKIIKNDIHLLLTLIDIVEEEDLCDHKFLTEKQRKRFHSLLTANIWHGGSHV